MVTPVAGRSASPRPFTDAQVERLAAAIADAERGNRGEVRVHVEPRCHHSNAITRAREVFAELNMHRTRDDTGVLLYLALLDRKAAVYAGGGIHDAGSPGFWRGVVEAVAAGGRGGRPVDGLLAALALIGVLLREHVPGEDTAGDELPSEVTFGVAAPEGAEEVEP